MKTIVVAGAFAALAFSMPADAGTARHHHRVFHPGYGPAYGAVYGGPFAGAYGAAVLPAAPGYGLFYDQGNFVNSDPDPFVRGQVFRDPNLGNQAQ